MKYGRNRIQNQSGNIQNAVLVGIGLLAAVAFFLFILLSFVIDGAAGTDTTNTPAADVLPLTERTLPEPDPTFYAVEEIELTGSDGYAAGGIARRGAENDIFTHVVVAELPTINQEVHFYEGWLVIPGVTQFFSTGPMFPREDGKWGLVYETDVTEQPDILDYDRVIITREPLDNNPAPDVHVAEGDF